MSDGFVTEGETAAGASWLLSMTDLVSLLVAFFIMLFAMSSVESEKWQALASIASAAKPSALDETAPLSEKAEAPAVPRVHAGDAADLGYLAAVLSEKLAVDPLLGGALLGRSPDGLVIALPSRLLFAPGSASTSPEANAALGRLGDALRSLDNAIEIHGYADPTPIHTDAFASNWELSLARARAVAAALRRAGYAHPLLALGRADSRFGELDTALPESERLRLARRVDVIVRPRATEEQP